MCIEAAAEPSKKTSKKVKDSQTRQAKTDRHRLSDRHSTLEPGVGVGVGAVKSPMLLNVSPSAYR